MTHSENSRNQEDSASGRGWQEVLGFWFPEEKAAQLDLATHREYWSWRMRGGAEADILSRYAELTAAAAAGRLDHWATDPEGRLALIIVLDQFSRSVWRDSARAYAQDLTALALTQEGLVNGHYAALTAPWRQIVFGLPLGHCEGADHLPRIDQLIGLREAVAAQAPAHLAPVYQGLVEQAGKVRGVIAAYGRHPHRNAILGRAATPAEEVYLAEKQFPHLQAFEGR